MPTARPLPPLVQLGALVLGDFVSTFAFAAAYSLSRSLAWSLGLALAAGVAGVVWTRVRGREVDLIQWLSLGLVVVFGGAAFLTHDPRFVMVKPTIIYVAVAAVMLKPGWMRRYLPAKAQRHGVAVTDAFGYVWSAGMATLAVANLALVAHGDTRLWAAFLAVAPLSLKLGLGLTQYALTRRTVVRAIRREQAGVAYPQTRNSATSSSANTTSARMRRGDFSERGFMRGLVAVRRRPRQPVRPSGEGGFTRG